MSTAAAPAPRATRPAPVAILPQPDELARRVIEVAADTYGIDAARILSRSRSKRAVVPRQAVSWALRCAGVSWPRIAASLGQLCHSSAIHADRATKLRHSHDPYALARDLGILDACGIYRPGEPCGGFIGFRRGDRWGDFAEEQRRAVDVCHRQGCGRRRGEHEETSDGRTA